MEKRWQSAASVHGARLVSRTCGFGGAAPQDETRPREPLRAASLKAAGISEPLSAASKPGKKGATVHALFTQKLHRV